MGEQFEPDMASAVEPEQSVHDVILQMLDEDSSLDHTVKDSVLDALAEVIDSGGKKVGSGAPTYLTSISVMGFRGIGSQAKLDLYPSPGLMVVSGRNGSGKSSFAEALELALTGTSYRWHLKEKMWEETWQNLHRPDPCAICIGFTTEGVGSQTIGLNWDAGAALTERSTWTQAGSEKRVDGTEHLGWARPLELWRPVLSYDELGRLFDGGPSALYDALAKLLGLEDLADAEKWLAAQLKSTKLTRDRSDTERKRLLAVLVEVDDERAQRATELLRKKGASLDDVLALATGSDDAASAVTPALRVIARLNVPAVDDIANAVSRLRAAVQTAASAAVSVADSTRQRVDLLEAALSFHDHAGDTECPVCGMGRLDAEWAASTRETVASTEHVLSEYRSATNDLKHARSAAADLVAGLISVTEVDGVELAALAAYNDSVATAQAVPDGDEALAAHLESTLVAVADAANTLRGEADAALKLRESAWAPVAAQLGGWVQIEQEARSIDGKLKTMTAAKKWMADHAAQFRNLRLQPVAAQAREIWG